ncbi:MAG TPA: hypothetical protein QGI07_08630 [Dehalococcoidia bacterium]|nr:hypothetical protein [Dehalococcoidia bacterium]MDP7160404.1 hypothetical protein [Dehalococcoidia bacterium]MDP7212178.1 hypothetical protein [Dehalococcoidia bacterium]HJM54068.1 hypothetical protein [Dehalococcoidia bacterium]
MPVTSVVTPWYALLSAPGWSIRVTSEWACMSMKPGDTTRPDASITRAVLGAASDRSVTAVIRPPKDAGRPAFRMFHRR